ncbi:hypothetical protein PR202_ga29607 [Eleusine coracana subsp. coracana]|uniref:Uncharacterized protein n=2 Tax=Magnoliopsida TaxID=3398 RepID=A0AAV5DML4_ELECO|nr:hypothetical protein PR202_ga29607 [Eleusine coracana subsp. coracana]
MDRSFKLPSVASAAAFIPPGRRSSTSPGDSLLRTRQCRPNRGIIQQPCGLPAASSGPLPCSVVSGLSSRRRRLAWTRPTSALVGIPRLVSASPSLIHPLKSPSACVPPPQLVADVVSLLFARRWCLSPVRLGPFDFTAGSLSFISGLQRLNGASALPTLLILLNHLKRYLILSKLNIYFYLVMLILLLILMVGNVPILQKNWNLFSVNVAMAGTGLYQLSRKIRQDYFSDEKEAAPSLEG